jgi:hypothetical protein
MNMKNNIGDLVASSMNQVLNSKEHASLFKKAYKHEGESCSSCMKSMDQCSCGYADDNNVSHKMCSSCGEDSDKCMCGDSMMADDANDARGVCAGCKKKPCTCHKADDNDVSHEDHDMSWADEEHKMATAVDSAMQDLLTASAALDYAGLSKASELTLKIATLVSEAKKGKVNLKKEDSSSKSTSSTSKSTSSTSKSTSSAPKAKKKMTMKERMKMLREKAEKAKKEKGKKKF